MDEIIRPLLYVMVGICIYCGFHQVQIWQQSREQWVHFFCSMMCFVLAGIAFCQTLLYSAETVQGYAVVARVTNVLAGLFVISVYWFLTHYTQVGLNRLALGLTVLHGAVMLFEVFTPYGIFFATMTSLEVVELPWGEMVAKPIGTAGIGLVVYYLCLLIFVAFLVYTTYRQWKFGEANRTRSVSIILAAFVMIAILDMAVVSLRDNLSVFSISEFAFLTVVLVANYSMSRHYIETQRELRRSEERFGMLIEAAPIAMCILGPGRILYVNPAWLQLTGMTQEEALKAKPTDLVHPEMRKMIAERGAKRLKGESVPDRYEMKGQNKHGELIWADLSATRINYLGEDAILAMANDITDHKMAVEALRESEEKYRLIVENAPTVSWATDPEGHTSFVSSNVSNIYGFTAEEICTGGPAIWFDRIHPDDVDRVREAYARLFKGEGSYCAEYRIRHKEGHWIWLHDEAEMISQDTEFPRAYGIFYDITERKTAEEALTLTQTAVDRAADAIFWIRSDGSFSYVNDAACAINGRPREEMLTLGVPDIDPNFPAERWRQYWNNLKQRKSLLIETSIQPSSGEQIPVEVRTTYVKHGGKEYSFAFLRDLTERKKTESELHRSTERFRNYMEQASEGIYLFEMANPIPVELPIGKQIKEIYRGCIAECNNALARMYGYESPEDLIGKSLLEIHGTDAKEENIKFITDLIQSDYRIIGAESLEVDKDGREKWFSNNIIGIVENRHLVRTWGTQTDITERKKAEAEAELRREQLVQADKMVSLGTLVSGVGHEINNPNGFITTSLDMIEPAFDGALPILDEYHREHGDFVLGKLKYSEARKEIPWILGQMKESTERISRIVGELRDFARVQPASLSECMDINASLKSAVTLVSNLIKRSTRHFRTYYAPDLPPVLGDHQRLEQVLVNILVNACQSLPDDSKAIRVSTNFNQAANTVTVMVEDEGVGIPAEHLSRLTDPFFTTKRDQGGTGLGLSVSAAIVADHKGQLKFTSEPDKGTLTTLSLPSCHGNSQCPP